MTRIEDDLATRDPASQLHATLDRTAERFPLGERTQGKDHNARAELPSLARPGRSPQLYLELENGMLLVQIRNLLSIDHLEPTHAAARAVIERESEIVKAAARDREAALAQLEAQALPLLTALSCRTLSASTLTSHVLLAINGQLRTVTIACDVTDGEIYLRGHCAQPQDDGAVDRSVDQVLFAAQYVTNCARFVQRVLEPWRADVDATYSTLLNRIDALSSSKARRGKPARASTVSI